MTRDDAITECKRWLDHLDKERQKSYALTKIASDMRTGKITKEDAQRAQRALDDGVKVYDGSRLADAVRCLIKEPT